ncbi:MAG: histidine triad nucleotide-binding protein [Oscillatoriales cyanobacterium RM2_1_1]|nr:histidine triad nucleotide-binding protein [Oscillatoriales cyanobacterium SM2_3_0]NJO45268.1 histidine triad nucleotide-binding protein [Oscillatoriales cyanobacterium RM2_1_1]
MTNSETVFSKIIRREISADIVYEDDLVLAFKDIASQAPFHVLLIPKKVIPSLSNVTPADQELLGHLLLTAHQIAKEAQLENGYRIVINNGADGGQTVYHLHLHILGGRQMQWPPG